MKKEEESPSVLKGKEEESTMCDELNFHTVRFERKIKESRKRVGRKMKGCVKKTHKISAKNTLAKKYIK